MVLTGSAERKLEIVKFLCRRRFSTLSELADEFGVSVRTIQRDLICLSGEMHIPIFCQYGKYGGGIYIDDDYRWDKMYMTQEQIALLDKISDLVSGMLSEQERQLYQQIINTYSTPSAK